MNETEKLLESCQKVLNLKGYRPLARVLNISHTLLYSQIKDNRISLKTYKVIKSNPDLKGLISQDYIINNILRIDND